MKLTTIKNKLIKPVHSRAGLLKGSVEYNIQSATSSMEWTGPKISPVVWNEILEFFWDTYQRTKSECQVRLYVNTKESKWAAWAYPQERGTGMTARELDNDEAKKQRAQFCDDWLYFGTVHHHCDSSAFQSDVDMRNEQTQDGLHITIGYIHRKQHDIHARFYYDGLEYVPDLGAFWDVGEAVRQLIPPDCYDKVARHQMTMPAPAGTTYPLQWKENIIKAPKLDIVIDDDFFPSRGVYYHGQGYHRAGSAMARGESANGANSGKAGLTSLDHPSPGLYGKPEWERRAIALKAVYTALQNRGVKLKHIENAFEFFSKNPFIHALRNAAGHSRIFIWDIIEEWEKEQDREEARKQLKIEQSKK